jgi:hypothetical protein
VVPAAKTVEQADQGEAPQNADRIGDQIGQRGNAARVQSLLRGLDAEAIGQQEQRDQPA